MFLWWQTVGSWNFGAWHYSAAGRAGSARLFHPSPDCALQSDDVDGHFRRAGPVESHEQRNFTSKFLGREGSASVPAAAVLFDSIRFTPFVFVSSCSFVVETPARKLHIYILYMLLYMLCFVQRRSSSHIDERHNPGTG